MCKELENYSAPCTCSPRTEGFAAKLSSAPTQHSWMLAMGRRQLCAFEHQHHPYFSAAVGECWLPAGASWKTRPVCQATCWGPNGEQIGHGGGKCCPVWPHSAAYPHSQRRTTVFLLLLDVKYRCLWSVI